MQATIDLDDTCYVKPNEITGVKEQALLINAGLRALIGSEEAQRLACIEVTQGSFRKVRTPGSARGLLIIKS